ncbi:Hypothetical protein D9617_13g099940 [Elsinoe fawcettii]|nr:Hypothetical protein D9617_13g099940 [Elsinoe fawcettii]
MASSLRPTANQYHVGWLCAIEIEYSVVIALLEPRYQAPLIPPDDPNHYTCGKIQGHNVVICCLAKDRHGIASAAATAQNMQRSFTNLRVRLMVGIGGGAPTATQDIRLGDVVVSSPARKGPAVIHYEFGKTIQNQDFHPIGFLSPPPTSLLNLLATVDAHHRLLGNGMRRTIRKMAKSYPLVADQIQRPHDSPDILYHSDFAHPNTFDSCKELDCLSTGTCVDRPARKDVKPRPHVHYGLIASADRLMKDAVMRDRLADRHGVLCFEMEAAGSMDTFPCLIIRGISDYSDSHKHDVWHGYAAAAAAAYASELLRKIPGVDKLPDFGMSTISLDSDLNEEYNKKHTRDSARPYQEAVDTTYSGTDGFGSRARMMGAPASPSGTKQAIFVLSIDDGDLPLSSLYMLKEAMYYLGDSKPCEYFDMIGGFGTGALIAIMLGRLRMTVDACINAILPLLSDFMAIRRLRHEDMRDPAESAIAQTNFERSMQQLLRDAPFEEGTAYKQRTLLKCHTH